MSISQKLVAKWWQFTEWVIRQDDRLKKNLGFRLDTLATALGTFGIGQWYGMTNFDVSVLTLITTVGHALLHSRTPPQHWLPVPTPSFWKPSWDTYFIFLIVLGMVGRFGAAFLIAGIHLFYHPFVRIADVTGRPASRDAPATADGSIADRFAEEVKMFLPTSWFINRRTDAQFANDL